MPKIFISYRRNDSQKEARLIAEKAIDEFGESSVFFDTHTLAVGEEFPSEIEANIQSATHMLVVIGPNWMDSDKASGAPRIHESDDWIRREIRLGLSRDMPIIPVLIENAEMPDRAALPGDVAPVCDYNAFTLPASAPGFRSALSTLIDRVRDRSALMTALSVFAMAAVAGMLWYLISRLLLLVSDEFGQPHQGIVITMSRSAERNAVSLLGTANDAIYIGALIYAALLAMRGHISIGRDRTLQAVSVAVVLYLVAGAAAFTLSGIHFDVNVPGIDQNHPVFRPLVSGLQMAMLPFGVLMVLKRRLNVSNRSIVKICLCVGVAFAVADYGVAFVQVFGSDQVVEGEFLPRFLPGSLLDWLDADPAATIDKGRLIAPKLLDPDFSQVMLITRTPAASVIFLWFAYVAFPGDLSLRGCIILTALVGVLPVVIWLTTLLTSFYVFQGLFSDQHMVVLHLRLAEAAFLFFVALALARVKMRRPRPTQPTAQA